MGELTGGHLQARTPVVVKSSNQYEINASLQTMNSGWEFTTLSERGVKIHGDNTQ
jgi:hypothetical protein